MIIKKLLSGAFIIAFSLYTFVASFLGTHQIFREYGLLDFGHGILIILVLILAILISGMVGITLYELIGKPFWGKKQ